VITAIIVTIAIIGVLSPVKILSVGQRFVFGPLTGWVDSVILIIRRMNGNKQDFSARF
jgi:hypothetical protein